MDLRVLPLKNLAWEANLKASSNARGALHSSSPTALKKSQQASKSNPSSRCAPFSKSKRALSTSSITLAGAHFPYATSAEAARYHHEATCNKACTAMTTHARRPFTLSRSFRGNRSCTIISTLANLWMALTYVPCVVKNVQPFSGCTSQGSSALA